MAKGVLALSIDCGTQSIRAIVFDKEGSVVASNSVKYVQPYTSPSNGWAEQDPMYWWSCLCVCTKHLFNDMDRSISSRICSVSISTMRDTYISLDSDMKILRPSIIWLDQRIAAQCPSMPSVFDLIFRIVGMRDVIEEQRQVTKTCWIAEHQKEIYDRMSHFLSIGCWFNWKLTGMMVDSVGNQCGHIPFDYKKGVFRKNGSMMWQATPVDTALLPPLVQCGTEIGRITSQAYEQTGIPEGIPVLAGATDKGCETLGCGVIDPDLAAISFGTTATVQLAMDRYVEPQKFMPAYQAAFPGHWNPEIQIYRGYWMVKWFASNFGLEERLESERTGLPVEPLLDRLLKQSPPGADGLILQPYWCPGLKLLESKGTIMGFSDYHTRAHLYRAILEGINFGLLDGLHTMQSQSRTKASGICISGGGSRSDDVCQMTCDMFGLTAYRCHTPETSSLGAAIIGFVGSGEFASYEEAVGQMVHYSTVFQPDSGRNEMYSRMYSDVYRKLYPRMKPLYKTMFRSQKR
ncbi:MAG: FGGY-family carbohydrate kinase [Sphaerochaetaceae bacterium]